MAVTARLVDDVLAPSLTLNEFLALPEEDENGNRFELSEGGLITLSPTGVPHGYRVSAITFALVQALDRKRFAVLVGEVGIIMSGDPKATVRGMDIAVVKKEDMPKQGMARKAPLLIVEVISPANDPEDMDYKRKQYQEFGVAELWLVYEQTKSIHVYRQADGKRTFDLIESPAPLVSHSLGIKLDTEVLFS